MVWYKYGTDPNTLACAPDSTATKTVNVNQLENSRLKYEFKLAGSDAKSQAQSDPAGDRKGRCG